jgi:hypothetical protein
LQTGAVVPALEPTVVVAPEPELLDVPEPLLTDVEPPGDPELSVAPELEPSPDGLAAGDVVPTFGSGFVSVLSGSVVAPVVVVRSLGGGRGLLCRG